VANPKATHILLKFPPMPNGRGGNIPTTIVLVRAKDGMCMGSQSGATVTFGEDPRNTEQRTFIDSSYALTYLKEKAHEDAPDKCAIFDERDGDTRVVLAGGNLDTGRPS
jgi:hypothetical protein